LRSYLTKKNLFIIKDYPDVFLIEDSHIILGTEYNIRNLNLDEIENVFTIFYLPIWIKSLLSKNSVNVVYLDRQGKPQDVILHKTVSSPMQKDTFLGLSILQAKANFMTNLFKIAGAVNLINLSLKNDKNLQKTNQHLNFLIKAVFIDTLCKKVRLQINQSREITDMFFNFTENIVAFSFYNRFINQNINTESGTLNEGKLSLIKDLTEIMRLRFLKKLHHLLEDKFFEKDDFNEKVYPITVTKFIKMLSTYFFYGNRFKRLKEISYIIQLYKRGRADEIFGSL